MRLTLPLAPTGAASRGRLRSDATCADGFTTVGAAMVTAAAILVALAGVVHLRFAAPHMEEERLYGVFFYGSGAAQLACAALLLTGRLPRRLLAAVVAASLAIVAMWVLSRTVGPPVGAGAWVREPVGFADIVTTAAELGTAMLLLPLLVRGERFRSLAARPLPAAVRTGAVLALALVAAPAALAATPAGHSHGRLDGSERCADAMSAPHGHPAGTKPHSDAPAGCGPGR